MDTLGTWYNLVGQAVCLQERMQGLACSQAGTVLVDPEARLLQSQLAGLLVGSGKTVAGWGGNRLNFLLVSTSLTLRGTVSRPVQTPGGRPIRPHSSRQRSEDLLPS